MVEGKRGVDMPGAYPSCHNIAAEVLPLASSTVAGDAGPQQYWKCQNHPSHVEWDCHQQKVES
eukprot:5907966-Amphidinium_carterae.3